MSAWPLPRLLAHRCGGTLAPENTFAGLAMALQWGCAGVEFDVMLGASGLAVLIHDETLERTTDQLGRVCEASDATLRAADAGSRFGAQFAGEPIPRFTDAIRRCRALGLAVNVEIKPAAGFEHATGWQVASLAAAGWAAASALPLLSSFSHQALLAAREAAPHLPRALLLDRLGPDWASQAAELGVCGIVTNTQHLDARAAKAVRDAGLGLGVYTENDPQRARQRLAWGVQTLISDRPDLLGDLG